MELINFGFSIPKNAWIGLALGIGGIVLAVVGNGLIKSTKILRVPDGIAPDAHFRAWKDGKLSNKVGRFPVFVFGFGLAMLFFGCGVLFFAFS